MLMLHAVMMLRAAVLLPQASTKDQLHRAGRHGGCGRFSSAVAQQIALAEQRQLSEATCSPRLLLLTRHGWRAYFEACAMSLISCICAQALACGQIPSLTVSCVRGTGYRRCTVRHEWVNVRVH